MKSFRVDLNNKLLRPENISNPKHSNIIISSFAYEMDGLPRNSERYQQLKRGLIRQLPAHDPGDFRTINTASFNTDLWPHLDRFARIAEQHVGDTSKPYQETIGHFAISHGNPSSVAEGLKRRVADPNSHSGVIRTLNNLHDYNSTLDYKDTTDLPEWGPTLQDQSKIKTMLQAHPAVLNKEDMSFSSDVTTSHFRDNKIAMHYLGGIERYLPHSYRFSKPIRDRFEGLYDTYRAHINHHFSQVGSNPHSSHVIALAGNDIHIEQLLARTKNNELASDKMLRDHLRYRIETTHNLHAPPLLSGARSTIKSRLYSTASKAEKREYDWLYGGN